MKKDVLSTKVTGTIIKYFESRGGDSAALLEGLGYDYKYLTSTENWVPWNLEFMLYERVERALGEKNIAHQVGRYSATPQTLGMLSAIIRLFTDPGSLLARGAKYIPYFNRSHQGEVEILNDHECIFSLWQVEETPYEILGCEHTIGVLEAIPTIFGLPLAIVQKETCFLKIDKAGRVGGLYYAVDDDGTVTAYFDKERTKSAGYAGRLNSDGTFTVNGIKFGEKSCRYHITYRNRYGFLRNLIRKLFMKSYHPFIEEFERANEMMSQRFDDLKKQELRKTRYAQLAMALVEKESFKEIISLAAEFAAEIIGATQVWIYMVDEDGELRFAQGGFATGNKAHADIVQNMMDEMDMHPESLKGAARRVIAKTLDENEPFVSNSLEAMLPTGWGVEKRRTFDEKSGINSYMIMPLKIKKEPLGIMVVMSAFDIELDALQPLVDITAQAISNFHRLEQIKKEKENIEKLRNIQLAMGEKKDLNELLDFIVKSALEIISGLVVKISLLGKNGERTGKEIVAQDSEELINLVNKASEKLNIPSDKLAGIQSSLDESVFQFDFRKTGIGRLPALSEYLQGIVPEADREKAAQELGIRDIAAVPLASGGNILGFMIFMSANKLDDDLLLMLSGQVAQAIREAQHLDEIDMHRHHLEEMVAARTDELEKKTCELEETQAIMLQQEKMAGIGQLAAGIAHEINNPLAYLYSNLNILVEYAQDIILCYEKMMNLSETASRKDDATARALAEEIQKAVVEHDIKRILSDLGDLVKESADGARRVKEIVQNMKDFARPGDDRLMKADLNAGIEQTLTVIHNELKYRVETHTDLNPLPLIFCYPKDMNQVFMNIVLNAAQAIPKKGDVWIRSGVKDGFIRVEIEDNGEGIPPDVVNRIFEPFFTTKQVGKGTGLGLAMAYGIVKRHGGSIEVQSEVGKGTIFTVILPTGGLPENYKDGVAAKSDGIQADKT